jgi:hypothetical protein
MKSKRTPQLHCAGKARRRIAAAVLLFAFVGLLTTEASAATPCPLTQGFWKNNTSAWALTSLTLGTTTYTAAQAEAILQTPVGSGLSADASLILADQLIAALLNIAAGAVEPSLVASTIADADAALGAGPIPENISPATALGQRMVNDAVVLNNYNNATLPGTCGPPPPPQGSCQPSGSLSVLVQGSNVTSYVPKGRWSNPSFSFPQLTGVSVVNIEGSSVTPTLIPTANIANSCASNSVTAVTVCTANNTDVYLLTGTTLNSTLTSGGFGSIGFSGGSCTSCGVAMDAIRNKAVIGLSLGGGLGFPEAAGFQFLDLGTTPAFETAFASPALSISEGLLLDPIHNLLLSANEDNDYEIANVTTSASPSFFENPVSNVASTSGPGELDSSAEECQTQIALAPAEFTRPSAVFIADLSQATYTPGTPAGTWSAPSQVQILSESVLPCSGASGIAVAQGTHTGVISDEFCSGTSGGFIGTASNITAIALPSTSGSGTPAITDWVTCAIPTPFAVGFDPHTVTAYQSPATGDAVAVIANGNATQVAVVDLTKMLNTTIVPRTVGGHACGSGTLPSTVVSFVSVP